MEKLHTVMRSIAGESKSTGGRRDQHLDVFREFLNHLDRAARKKAPRAKAGRKGARKR